MGEVSCWQFIVLVFIYLVFQIAMTTGISLSLILLLYIIVKFYVFVEITQNVQLPKDIIVLNPKIKFKKSFKTKCADNHSFAL